jgi:hypothetical protein
VSKAVRAIVFDLEAPDRIARGGVEFGAADVRVRIIEFQHVRCLFFAFVIPGHPLNQDKRIGRQTEAVRKDLNPIHLTLLRLKAHPVLISRRIELSDQLGRNRNPLRLLRLVVWLLFDNDGCGGEAQERRI